MMLERVNNELQKELNVIIGRELKDPRITGIVSVTAVETAKDLKSAKVFVSIMDDEKSKEVLKTLNGASAYMRGLLFDRLKIRTVPHLAFHKDNSVQNAMKIERLLNELHNDKENEK